MSARRSDSRSDVTVARESRKKKTERPKLVLFVIFFLFLKCSSFRTVNDSLSEIDPDVVGKIFVCFQTMCGTVFGKRK